MNSYRTKIALLGAASMALVLAGCSSNDDTPAPSTDPSAALSSSQTSIARGQKVTLTWSSQNADSCAASGDWSGDKAASGGSEEVGPLRKDSSYTLTCSGGGKTDAKTATVTAGPVVQPAVFTGFPVTLKDAQGDTSVSYKGQMSRNVLRESAKAATREDTYTLGRLENYIKNENKVIDDQVILAPKTKGDFIIKETIYNELGTGRNLYGKLYGQNYTFGDPSDPIPGVLLVNKDFTLGMPGTMTSMQVIDFWIDQFKALNAGNTGQAINVDMTHGYDYNQLFPKYLMGAVFYYQTSNLYLDEFISEPGVQDNDLPYNSDPAKHYTGKEHSWDEGFGYFGAAAHYNEMTANQRYYSKKMSGYGTHTVADVFAAADKNADGTVSLYTEYNSGSAYYSALFDKDDNSNTTYGEDIMNAFLAGRTVIANAVDGNGDARKLTTAERTEIMGYAATVQQNWEKVFAEAVYRYAGLSHQKISALELVQDDANRKEYYKMWAEMKGFMLALQYGGGDNAIINLTKFTEIDDLIGYGPVLEDGSQVTGITGGAYVKSAAGTSTLAAYKASLKQVQGKLDALYTLGAKLEAIP